MDLKKKISNLIYSIEQDFPVEKWRINGIDIWPIIRVKLQTKINVQGGNKLTRKSTSYSSYPTFNLFQKINQIVVSYFRFFKLKKVDFVATSNFSHRSIYKGEYYNKFYDPILEDVNRNGLILEHNSQEFYQNHPIHNDKNLVYFEDLFYYRYFFFSVLKKLKLFKPLKNVELENYDEFLSRLNELEGIDSLGSEFEINKLESIVFNLFIYSKSYKAILKKTQPKFTFEICHYNTNSIALSIASKQLNIPSIEIQHGGQPKSHMAYSQWTNVPSTGFNTLPEMFWNWDQESKENMEQWIAKNDFHKSVVLGNPWIDFMKNKITNKEKQFIVYSLQPFNFELIFPEYLLNFIKANQKYKWWFRIHPTDVNRKEEYLSFFEEKGITNLIKFDDGSKESLPETLSQAILHVTYSSGTVFEAKEYGLKSILLDKVNAVSSYKSLIESHDAFIMEEENIDPFFEKVLSLEKNDKELNKNYTSCFDEIKKLVDR